MELVGNQKKVRKYGKGPLLVEAGPGSGKTTVIVERIKYLLDKGVDPETFLVITFTTKAADNLKSKLRESVDKSVLEKMQISTIHSFCIEYLKTRDKRFKMLDDDNSEMKSLFILKNQKRLGFRNESTIFNYHIPAVIDKFGEYTSFKLDPKKLISHLKEKRPVSEDYLDFVSSLDFFSKKRVLDNGFKDDWYTARYHQTAKAYEKYLEIQDEQKYVDFDTLQKKTLEELEKHPKTQYTTVFIDEFQDTDPLQFRIFRILQKNSEYFMAVGDVDQHIYAFRSSFADYFEKMRDACNAEVISLDVNFRSTKSIVNVSDSFIKHQRKGYSKKHLTSYNEEYDNDTFIIRNGDNFEEAQRIFEIIQKLKESGKIHEYGEVAVLYRKHSNKTIPKLLELLAENDINFTIKEQKDLENKDEIQSIITLLWYLTRKTHRGHILSTAELKKQNIKAFCGEYFEPKFWSLSDETKRYITELEDEFEKEVIKVENEIREIQGNSKVRAFGRVRENEDQDNLIEIFNRVDIPVIDPSEIENEDDRKFFERLEEMRDSITSAEPPTILELYYELVSMGSIFDDFDRNSVEVKNLAMLTQTIYNYESFMSRTDVKGLFYFLTSVIRGYSSSQPDDLGVQLMTVHSAKGLEFPVAIIPSLEKDKFPGIVLDPEHKSDVVNAKDTYYTPNECLDYKDITLEEENRFEIDEEERIVYVAMTRASDLLILSTVREIPERINDIMPLLKDFSMDYLDDVTIEKHFTNLEEEKLKLNYSAYSTYMLCPHMYNLIYNLGFRVSDEEVTNLGSVFHEIMEEVNLRLKNNGEVSEDELKGITKDVYESFLDIEEDPEQYERFTQSVSDYFNQHSVNVDVLETELPFEIEKDNFILNGAIDLVYRISDTEIGILDYKNAEVNDDKIRKYTPQIHTYAAALKEMPEYENCTISEAFIHFVKSDCKHPVDVNYELCRKQLDSLDEVALSIADEVFPKRESGFCGVCKFRKICK